MGEIRVKVRLTNAADISIVRRGMMDPKSVRWCDIEGVVDTGAVRTIIPIDIMKRLGLEETGRALAGYADCRTDNVPVTEPMQVDICERTTVEDALVLGDEVLIGQTVLEKLDLLADCRNQRVIPNPAHPYQAVTKVR